MLPKKVRRRKSFKKTVLLFFGFCILFSIITVFLIHSVFFVKKTLFISPVTTNSNVEKNIEKLLLNAQISFGSVTLSQDSCKVVLKDGGEAILSLRKNVEKQIASLQPILKQLTIEGKKFNRIDFRFDKPLVVYD